MRYLGTARNGRRDRSDAAAPARPSRHSPTPSWPAACPVRQGAQALDSRRHPGRTLPFAVRRTAVSADARAGPEPRSTGFGYPSGGTTVPGWGQAINARLHHEGEDRHRRRAGSRRRRRRWSVPTVFLDSGRSPPRQIVLEQSLLTPSQVSSITNETSSSTPRRTTAPTILETAGCMDPMNSLHERQGSGRSLPVV